MNTSSLPSRSFVPHHHHGYRQSLRSPSEPPFTHTSSARDVWMISSAFPNVQPTAKHQELSQIEDVVHVRDKRHHNRALRLQISKKCWKGDRSVECLSDDELTRVRGTPRVNKHGQFMNATVRSDTGRKIVSLQKLLLQEQECSSALKQENKDLKSKNSSLENTLSTERVAFEIERRKNEDSREETEALNKQLNDAKVLLKKSEDRCDTLKQDQKKMRDVVEILCGDLLGAHNGMEIARMKTRHAVERCKEAEKRLARERTDVNCITSRIEKLHELQQTMHDLIDGTSIMNVGTARSSRSEKGRIIRSMFRKMLSKVSTRKRMRRVVSRNDPICNNHQEGNDKGNTEQGSSWEITPCTARSNDDVALGWNNPEHFEDLQRGTESKKLWGFRHERKYREERAEELHRLVTEDITTLSDIIKKKSDVIEEMESALEDMRKKMSCLEEKLQNQREGRRKKKWMKDSRLRIIRTLENELVRRNRSAVSGWCHVRGSGTVGESGTIR